MIDNSHTRTHTQTHIYYLYILSIQLIHISYIVIYSYPIGYILYNVYCNTNTYESAILYSRMGCRQDRHICNSQQQETGLAASPNIYYVIVYPVRNA